MATVTLRDVPVVLVSQLERPPAAGLPLVTADRRPARSFPRSDRQGGDR